jgi:hypothetical protein
MGNRPAGTFSTPGSPPLATSSRTPPKIAVATTPSEFQAMCESVARR